MYNTLQGKRSSNGIFTCIPCHCMNYPYSKQLINSPDIRKMQSLNHTIKYGSAKYMYTILFICVCEPPGGVVIADFLGGACTQVVSMCCHTL